MGPHTLYQTIFLLNNEKVDIIMPEGGDYSRAMFKYSQQREFDVTLFLMAEICRVNDQKASVDYYAKLTCDSYLRILEVLNAVITPIK